MPKPMRIYVLGEAFGGTNSIVEKDVSYDIRAVIVESLPVAVLFLAEDVVVILNGIIGIHS